MAEPNSKRSRLTEKLKVEKGSLRTVVTATESQVDTLPAVSLSSLKFCLCC